MRTGETACAMNDRPRAPFPVTLRALALLIHTPIAGAADAPFAPVIPRTYDDAETATWHVPLALAKVSPSFLTSSYFYARKVRPIYRTYPVYHPDREPPGYLDVLKAA